MSGLKHWNEVIEKYDLLTHEEEAELVRRRDAGDESAVEELIMGNLRDLMRKVKMMNWKDETELHDLFMAGMEGMRVAAQRFVPMHKEGFEKPARLMHYSYFYVRDHIRKFCREFGNTKVMSLDAPKGADGEGDGYSSFNSEASNAEQILGTVTDSTDDLDLSYLMSELTKTQLEVFGSRVLHAYPDSDEDLAYITRVKPERVNHHLVKAVLKLIEVTDYQVPEAA